MWGYSFWNQAGWFPKNYLLFGWGGKTQGRELFLHLLFLNCLQLKIICMSKWQILGWNVLIPFNSKKVMSFQYLFLLFYLIVSLNNLIFNNDCLKTSSQNFWKFKIWFNWPSTSQLQLTTQTMPINFSYSYSLAPAYIFDLLLLCLFSKLQRQFSFFQPLCCHCLFASCKVKSH